MFLTVTRSLLEGFGTTCLVFFAVLVVSIPLGLPIAFACMSKWAPFRGLARRFPKNKFAKTLAKFRPISALFNTWVWIIRGTPLMLQLVIIFYGPGLLFGSSPSRELAAFIAFILNYSAYFAVIYQGGIEGIPKGQYEAGAVLGMTKSQVFFKVILLQVIKRIVPPMSNEIITLVKDTSLVRIIAIREVIMEAQSFIKSEGLLWPLFYSGAFYLVFNGLLTILFNYIQRKLDYFKA
ncbi:MAG: amino acid ABC transporter permease [Christensenellaceae bacterium]|nr:amino acid ABC transporter permease [Christensenellaceae bacterium]